MQGKTSTAMYNDDELESFAYVDNLEALEFFLQQAYRFEAGDELIVSATHQSLDADTHLHERSIEMLTSTECVHLSCSD